MTLDTSVASGGAIEFGNNDRTLGQIDEPSDGVGTLNDDDGITLVIRPERLITTGFYTVTGRLFQIEG